MPDLYPIMRGKLPAGRDHYCTEVSGRRPAQDYHVGQRRSPDIAAAILTHLSNQYSQARVCDAGVSLTDNH